jgi:hypothetical protein
MKAPKKQRQAFAPNLYMKLSMAPQNDTSSTTNVQYGNGSQEYFSTRLVATAGIDGNVPVTFGKREESFRIISEPLWDSSSLTTVGINYQDMQDQAVVRIYSGILDRLYNLCSKKMKPLLTNWRRW